MYEFLNGLITKPFLATIAVLVIWLILHVFLVKFGKLSKSNWARLEFVWIGIGFLGVLAIIAENREKSDIAELKWVSDWIETDYRSITSFTSNEQLNCLKFINTSLFSQAEFEKRQARQDSICSWTRIINIFADSTYRNGKVKLKNIPKLNISKPESEYSYNRINELVTRLNINIEKRDALKSKLQERFWHDFKYSFGILLLLFAFGLRLTFISYKVKDSMSAEIKENS